MAIIGPMEYHARQYGSGHSNSGASGRRKTRARNVMANALVGGVKTIIQHCNDQRGGLGTGLRVPLPPIVRGRYQGVWERGIGKLDSR